MTPFRMAWLNLLHQWERTLISLAGIAFAVILLFMQLGFLGAVRVAATLLFEHLHFDLILASTEYVDLNRPGSIPRERLARARAAEGVLAVEPLWLQNALWRDFRLADEPDLPPRRWGLKVLAADPAAIPTLFRDAGGPVFATPGDLARARDELARPGRVLIDRGSWPEFGNPRTWTPGSAGEVNGQRVELAGSFDIGTGFGYNSLLLTNPTTFHRLTGRPLDRAHLALVRLEPGTDAAGAQARLAAVLGPGSDARAFTRAEIYDKEDRYWVKATSVGQFFTLGIVVALVVGVIFVYQMMLAEIRNRLPEYATVKAMGYDAAFVRAVVLAQSVLLALVGFVPGFLGSLFFYDLTRRAARVPMTMTGGRVLFVLALAVVMSLASGVLAARKVRKADPADLF